MEPPATVYRESSDAHAIPHVRVSARARARTRARQQQLFYFGGVLFAVYYVGFWLLDIYSTPSLLVGVLMAAGLVLAGSFAHRGDARGSRHTAVAVAALLAIGANASALLSDGSHCLGFHTIWALPLIYGLFAWDDWLGSLTVAALSLLLGLGILVRDGESFSRILQWSTLAASAGVFAFVQQSLARRDLELTLSESEQAQSQLALADRMASIGMLAAGVAHEINNPLTYVATNLQFVGQRLNDADVGLAPKAAAELTEALGDALGGCDRVTAIVRTLSRLSRSQGSDPAPVDVNRAIMDVIKLSRRDIERIARLQFVAGEISTITGDEARLGQVFLNLLVNAAHAVEQRPEGPRTIEVRTFVRAPDRVVVEVRDSGCGIPPERIGRIFEPFFTTKASNRGTGLGLALCAEIVDQHAGAIEVESTQGTGSVFRVVLPNPHRSALPRVSNAS